MDVILTVLLIRKPLSVSIRSRSVTDPVRSGYVLGNICWHGSVTDERDATRTSMMGIRTIRSLTDEIRKNYGYRICTNLAEKSHMLDGLGILSDFKHAATDRYG